MRLPVLLLAVLAAACSSKPTGKEVAEKLTGAGILASCVQKSPRALTARASEYFTCDLPSVPGEGAGVMVFAKTDDYAATVKAFEAAAVLAGPHRYGNEDALVFVQLNDGASLDVGNKTKAIVAGF